jgi:SIR2-like domain
MSVLTSDPLTQLAFSVYENKGVFAVLLGSGLSRAADIPTGWEITLDLIRRVAAAQGVEGENDWAAWYRETAGREPNYSALLEELAASPDERRSILHSYIEPTEEDREEGRKIPTAAHHAIAELVAAGYVRVIVTTNFDRLMENALRERGIEPSVVASADALQGAEPITHSHCYILKLHGDYKDARILNTDEELSGYPAAYDQLLERIFDEFGLIVCGWSGEWDHALRTAMLRSANRRYSFYWAARGEPGAGAQEIIAHRRAKVMPIPDADGFFSGLSQRVQTLDRTHRQNPLSIELLVASAKRYLAKPEFRIQLDELFADEAERLVARLDGEEFRPDAGIDVETLRTRISRYEAASEPLARMAGVLGRWGDDSELVIVLDLLRAIQVQAGKLGAGITGWLDLRDYPAVLIFTAYGLGLTRAQRWPALHRFLDAPLVRQHQEPKRVVESFFLWAWKGANIWKNLEGYERRHTPLSDYLFEVFTDWSRSFAGLSPEFELLFERFEMLSSVTHIERTEKDVIKAEHGQFLPKGFIFMPVGRSAWHSMFRQRLMAEFRSETMLSDLLAAGFARGDAEHLELALVNYERIAGKMW